MVTEDSSSRLAKIRQEQVGKCKVVFWGNQSEWRVSLFAGGEGGEGEEAALEGQPKEEPEEEEEITSPIFVQNGEIRGKFEIYVRPQCARETEGRRSAYKSAVLVPYSEAVKVLLLCKAATATAVARNGRGREFFLTIMGNSNARRPPPFLRTEGRGSKPVMNAAKSKRPCLMKPCPPHSVLSKFEREEKKLVTAKSNPK